MKAIILGSQGFFGRNLYEYLDSLKGFDIIGIDKTRNEFKNKFYYLNLSQTDVFPSISDRLEQLSPDVIFNVAGNSSVDSSIDNPLITTQNNINIILNLLTFAKKNPATSIIHVSTDEVTGDSGNHITSSPYSASKLAQEALINSYRKTFGIKTVILRCCNNFGPYQGYRSFVPKTIFSLIKGESPEVWFGDRKWISIKDTCKQLVSLTYKDGLYHQHGYAVSNLYMAQKINKILNKNVLIKEIKSPRLGYDFSYHHPYLTIEENNERILYAENFGKNLKETVDYYINLWDQYH